MAGIGPACGRAMLEPYGADADEYDGSVVGPFDAVTRVDARPRDAQVPDSSLLFDTGLRRDAGFSDRGRFDSGRFDFGVRMDALPRPDTSLRDFGVRDFGVRDFGVRDFGVRDGPNVLDIGLRDTGVRDTGLPDAGQQVPVGAMCRLMTPECGPGGFCIDEGSGFPGGYCSASCNNPGMQCPMGSVCRSTGGPDRICLKTCNGPNDCRQGYACLRLGIDPQRVCWPIPPSSMNPMGGPVGSPCQRTDQCVTGLQCLNAFMGAWPGGYCTIEYCDPGAMPCPGGSACYAFPGLFSLCLASCPSGGSQSTCRPGYYCLGPTGQPGVCITN